jgi:hypothetical protein
MVIYFLYDAFSDEKVGKASSASINRDRTLTGFDKMERKMTGRKMDFVFFRQCHEYGCCECGRYDDEMKELHNGGFKMVKVLKDCCTICARNLWALYATWPLLPFYYLVSKIKHFSYNLLLILLSLYMDIKFTVVLCDAPAGYVCRINHRCPVDLPEEARDIGNNLLLIMKAVYQARLMM